MSLKILNRIRNRVLGIGSIENARSVYKGTANYVACAELDELKQFIEACVSNDAETLHEMLGTTAVEQDSLLFEPIHRDELYTRIRVFIGDGSAEMWTVSEGLRCKV